MCSRCNYRELLEQRSLEPTHNRLIVLETLGECPHPLAASEVLDRARTQQEVNRVTVYRILELLVENKLVERISSGDRAFRYGLAPNDNHLPHPHFFCTTCGRMECLSPGSLPDLDELENAAHGAIDSVQLRVDGTCRRCLQNRKITDT